ncbi:MAG: DsbA family protein, partial [Bacillus sp. (in: Bacteria)]|nr:DsbA family protein [Bacillus sp. (in: firmicutes)]
PTPSLKTLLEKEGVLFSKEIEVLYNLEQSEFNSYIEAVLSSDDYKLSEILGEVYIVNTTTVK